MKIWLIRMILAGNVRMENLLMKKYLIRTVLVLAAITACNKEVETHVVDNGQEEVTPGMVTMTFTAAMGEETRTAYPDDKTGKWVVGDQITVCVTKDVTDGEQSDYKLYNFTATGMSGELMEFSGSVKDGYTTIVSGIYPVSNKTVLDDGEVVSNHVFTAGAVTSVYLPDTYNLGTANDGGIALPMVGEMVVPEGSETPTFTFHHICGALKIEVIDIFNALTFTTAGEPITGLFPLNKDGRIAIETATSTGPSTVTFNYGRLPREEGYVGERENRTFYIPVPDGTLTAGATMALKNNEGVIAYEKTTSAEIAYESNVIKRLPAIGLVKKTSSSWSITVSSADPGGNGIHTHYVPSGTSYIYLFTPIDKFNQDFHGSVAEFIEKNGLSNKIYTKSTKFTMSTQIDKCYGETYIALTCAVTNNGERRVLFDYNKFTYQFDDPATSDYSYWLGEWEVYDNVSSTPKQDHWTIERSITNSSFIVKGIFNGSYTTYIMECEALLEGTDMKFLSQKVKETSKYKYFLLGSTGTSENRIEGEGNDIMIAQKDGDNSAFLYPIAPVKRYYLIAYYVSDGSYYNHFGYRFLTSPAPMTRVTETE